MKKLLTEKDVTENIAIYVGKFVKIKLNEYGCAKPDQTYPNIQKAVNTNGSNTIDPIISELSKLTEECNNLENQIFLNSHDQIIFTPKIIYYILTYSLCALDYYDPIMNKLSDLEDASAIEQLKNESKEKENKFLTKKDITENIIIYVGKFVKVQLNKSGYPKPDQTYPNIHKATYTKDSIPIDSIIAELSKLTDECNNPENQTLLKSRDEIIFTPKIIYYILTYSLFALDYYEPIMNKLIDSEGASAREQLKNESKQKEKINKAIQDIAKEYGHDIDTICRSSEVFYPLICNQTDSNESEVALILSEILTDSD